jgi:signal transduction histidine kinase
MAFLDNSDSDVQYTLKKIGEHTELLNKHRYTYKILLLVSVFLLVGSIVFLYVCYALNKDRSEAYNIITYISSGLIALSIIIILIFIYTYYNKERNNNINVITNKVKDLGKAVDIAQKEATEQKEKATNIQNAVRNFRRNTENLKSSESQLESLL